MTVIEFQNKIKKEYLFNKYWNYFFATLAIFGGSFFLYKILLTKWANNMSITLITFTLIFSFYLLYIGIIGFARTSNLDKIEIISRNPNVLLNKENIFKAAKNLNLKTLPSDTESLIKFETKNIIFEKRDLIILINDEGIFANIQQRNWNGPTFLGYNGSLKMIEKLKFEIKRLHLK